MVVKFCDDISLELKVNNRESLYGFWSFTEAKVFVGDNFAEFAWTREHRSDEELELIDLFEKIEALVSGGEKLADQIEYSIAVISCAKDKVGSLIREGEMWDTAKLISSLLLGRFSTRSEAVQELERVRGRLLVDALEAQIR